MSIYSNSFHYLHKPWIPAFPIFIQTLSIKLEITQSFYIVSLILISIFDFYTAICWYFVVVIQELPCCNQAVVISSGHRQPIQPLYDEFLWSKPWQANNSRKQCAQLLICVCLKQHIWLVVKYAYQSLDQSEAPIQNDF